MSQINFESLANELPELQPAWLRLEAWFDRNKRVKFIDIRRLAREIPEVDGEELALALQELVRHHFLQQIYRVETPDGKLLDDEFTSVSEIPDSMPYHFHADHFQTQEGDIIPGFRWESCDATS
jgi:hypothetical protein